MHPGFLRAALACGNGKDPGAGPLPEQNNEDMGVARGERVEGGVAVMQCCLARQ